CNKKGKNGNTLIKTLTFYGYFNFKIFQEKIGFLHPEKNRRLANWINNIQIIRLEKNERKSLFIKTIRENPLLNAKQISEKINIHHHYALNYLNNLWTQELVKKTSNEWPRRWYLSDKALRID
ncbi:MAG: hypothetical protein L6408_01945, partial [Nanoarchaeota archaeon]|nr:hypothetical protein [Nanoarchaeota archaeon]